MNGIDFNNLPHDPETSQRIIEKSFDASNRERELGRLGKFFGSGDTVKMNIAGLTICLALFIGVCYTVCILFCDYDPNKKLPEIDKFWAILTPIISLALGFIFGKALK